MKVRHLNSAWFTRKRAGEASNGLWAAKSVSSNVAENAAMEGTKGMPARTSRGKTADTHLTDDQFIGYSSQISVHSVRRQVDEHLRICSDCSAEIQRLERLAACWNDERHVQQLEGRIRSLVALQGCIRAKAGLASTFRQEVRTPLHALVPQPGAYAGGDDCPDPVGFYVTEEGNTIRALQGALQRKNEEYYVRVHTPRPEDRVRFHDRKVRITLSDMEHAAPILQRNIDVGVVVLLGTALPLTETCYVVAQLLPVVEVEELEPNL